MVLKKNQNGRTLLSDHGNYFKGGAIRAKSATLEKKEKGAQSH